MSRGFRLLAILLMVAVMQNGVLASPVMPEPVQKATGHAHHGHDGKQDHDLGRHAPDTATDDCCATGACDCGCASTSPAAASRPKPIVRDWARIAGVRAENVIGDLPGFTGAPYRPPA